MKKTIGILAHVDAGKTTFSEQLLYHTHSIRSLGRVDRQSSFLDTDPIEKARGITIFSGLASFSTGVSAYTLVDTPGHADFSAEMERTLQILDFAIVLVSCVEGVQGHTEAVWRQLDRHRIPTLFFLNKTDRAGADPARVLAELQSKLSPDALDFSTFTDGGGMPLELCEEIASRSDELLERYLETGYDRNEWLAQARRLLWERRLFPVFRGSALTGEGIAALLSGLDLLTECDYASRESAPFGARIYQIRHDSKANRLVFLKVTSGILPVKTEFSFTSSDGSSVVEKINEIRRYSGTKYQLLTEARAGDICAVTGLSTVVSGDSLGNEPPSKTAPSPPVLRVRVICGEVPPQTVWAAFRTLEDEDPSLCVEWDTQLQELRIRIMGEIQLEVLREIALERFGLEISFGPCEIRYLETIAFPVVGIGHFEPLRHYAEVHLRLSPGERGSGIVFESACPTDLLDSNYQHLVRTHVLEKIHRGTLTGAPVTDIKITLLNGRAHLKHTEGGDFREATYRAIRQGLAQAEIVLLEPYYDFTVTVPEDALGRVLSDIQKQHGRFEPPTQAGGNAAVQGHGPVACFLHYAAELPAFTKGRGCFTAAFGGYEPCHNREEVVLETGYEMEHDLQNPADSVFCAKGAGFTVKWHDVPQYAHLPVEKG